MEGAKLVAHRGTQLVNLHMGVVEAPLCVIQIGFKIF
jgi:hypothetical protein